MTRRARIVDNEIYDFKCSECGTNATEDTQLIQHSCPELVLCYDDAFKTARHLIIDLACMKFNKHLHQITDEDILSIAKEFCDTRDK